MGSTWRKNLNEYVNYEILKSDTWNKGREELPSLVGAGAGAMDCAQAIAIRAA